MPTHRSVIVSCDYEVSTRRDIDAPNDAWCRLLPQPFAIFRISSEGPVCAEHQSVRVRRNGHRTRHFMLLKLKRLTVELGSVFIQPVRYLEALGVRHSKTTCSLRLILQTWGSKIEGFRSRMPAQNVPWCRPWTGSSSRRACPAYRACCLPAKAFSRQRVKSTRNPGQWHPSRWLHGTAKAPLSCREILAHPSSCRALHDPRRVLAEGRLSSSRHPHRAAFHRMTMTPLKRSRYS